MLGMSETTLCVCLPTPCWLEPNDSDNLIADRAVCLQGPIEVYHTHLPLLTQVVSHIYRLYHYCYAMSTHDKGVMP